MAEEAAFVAQEFVSSLDNLPFEVAHILNEIKVKEKRVQELTERLSQRSQGVLKHIRSSTLGTAPANPKEAQTLSKIASEFDKVQALQHEKIVLAERLSLLVEKHTRRLASDVLQRVADLGGVEKPVVPPLVLTAPTSVRKVERAGGGAGGGGAEGLGAMAAVGTPGHHQPSVMAMPPPASTERGDNKKRRLNALHPQTGTPTSQSPIPFFGNYPGGGGVPGSNGFPPQSGTPGGINGPAGPGAGAAGYATPTPASAQQGAAASAAAGGAAAARGSTKRRRADEEEEEEEDEDEDAEGEPEDLEADGGADDDTLYCLCRQKSFGEMVGCDNEKCSIEWFHIKCVDLQVPLPERWFCPACVALGAGRTNKRDRKSGGGRK